MIYIHQNYDNRLYHILECMQNLYELMIIYEDKAEEMQKTYDVLSKMFAEETAGIKDKNGIKKIDKHITYYANGLIEYDYNARYAKLASLPFEYDDSKAKHIMPKYDLFKRDNRYYYYSRSKLDPEAFHAPASDLIANYLRSKLKNKPAPKMPRLMDLLNELKTFTTMIKTPDRELHAENYKFIRQYATKYEELVADYIKAISFVSDPLHGTLDPDSCPIGRRHSCSNPFAPMMYKNGWESRKQEPQTSEYAELLRMMNSYGYSHMDPIPSGDPCAIYKMPVLSAKAVEKIVNMYNKLYNERIQQAIAYRSDDNISLVNYRDRVECEVQDDIKKYYMQLVTYLDSELLKNDPTYKDWGYAAMLVEKNYDDASLLGFERVMYKHDNNIIPDSASATDRIYNTRTLFPREYNANVRKDMIKPDINPDFYLKHEDQYIKYVENIKISTDFMIACLEDVIKSLSGIKNNPDLIKWMAKRAIIPANTVPVIDDEIDADVDLIDNTEPEVIIIDAIASE